MTDKLTNLHQGINVKANQASSWSIKIVIWIRAQGRMHVAQKHKDGAIRKVYYRAENILF